MTAKDQQKYREPPFTDFLIGQKAHTKGSFKNFGDQILPNFDHLPAYLLEFTLMWDRWLHSQIVCSNVRLPCYKIKGM